jgi:hypothetical protein
VLLGHEARRKHLFSTSIQPTHVNGVSFMVCPKPLVATTLASIAIAIALSGCSPTKPDSAANAPTTSGAAADAQNAATATKDEEHGHKKGAHGGIIVSLGRDSYHVEAIVTSAGELRLYTLGNDETRVMEIAAQNLAGFAKLVSESESIAIEIAPKPQPGDSEGKASLFVAQLPETLVGKSIDVTVPSITIEGERFRLGFTTESQSHGDDAAMPAKVADDDEKKLYLTPGGIYTQSDIEANGNVTASQKFAGFKAEHDLKPKIGDKICPVTLTKANPKCSWIVGGKTYEFCCPPCVDEFVALAKSKPEEVKAPEDYVKQNPATGNEPK